MVKIRFKLYVVLLSLLLIFGSVFADSAHAKRLRRMPVPHGCCAIGDHNRYVREEGKGRSDHSFECDGCR